MESANLGLWGASGVETPAQPGRLRPIALTGQVWPARCAGGLPGEPVASQVLTHLRRRPCLPVNTAETCSESFRSAASRGHRHHPPASGIAREDRQDALLKS